MEISSTFYMFFEVATNLYFDFLKFKLETFKRKYFPVVIDLIEAAFQIWHQLQT